MGEIINRRRNIFINSEQYHRKNGDVNLQFPGDDFAVNKNEMMRISLESFVMRRPFYNVNDTNNKFYITFTSSLNVTTIVKEVKIEHGDYHDMSELETAVQTALNAVNGITGAVVTSNTNTRKLTINMSNVPTSGNWFGADSNFACFQAVNQIKPATLSLVSSSGFFNDSCELLGAKRTSDVNNIIFGFDISGDEYTSFFSASLFTLEALHLTTNLQTHSYQTPNFDAFSQNSNLIPSPIFAKIPISQNVKDLIKYQDSGSDAFSVDLQNKSLNSIILKLQDNKGRPLEELCEDDSLENGMVNFVATLKWAALNTPELGKPSGYPTELQMKLYNN